MCVVNAEIGNADKVVFVVVVIVVRREEGDLESCRPLTTGEARRECEPEKPWYGA